jgi:hypothetical protein
MLMGDEVRKKKRAWLVVVPTERREGRKKGEKREKRKEREVGKK